MAFSSGKDGRLYIDGKQAAKVVDWSLNVSVPSLATTTLGDTDTTNVAGVRTTTGSATLFYYATSATDNTTNSASVLINKVIKAASNGQGAESEKTTLKLGIENGTKTPYYIQGTCLITSVAMTMAVGSVLSAEVDFEFDGAPRAMNI